MLVSRHGGAPAWSPDGKRLAIANLPPPDPTYNGNPERNTDEPPPLFAGADAFRLWLVDAPLPVDSGEREIVDGGAAGQSAARRLRSRVGDAAAPLLFDRAVRVAMAGAQGAIPSAGRRRRRMKPRSSRRSTRWWRSSRSSSRSSSRIAPSSCPDIRSPRAPARSRSSGAATSSTPRSRCRSRSACVEPDASGIGGDGMALSLSQGDGRARRDRLQGPGADPRDARQSAAHSRAPVTAPRPRTSRASSPASICCIGTTRASGFPWADLIAPAIDYAESGYELDTALPTTIAEGRKFFEKYRASARIYLPDGKVPKAGDRFVNKDYAATLQDDRERRRRRVLPRIDRPAHRRRHGEKRRPHHGRRSGAVSRDRAPAARRPVSRSSDLLGAAAGVDRRRADRDAADSRELPAAARRDLRHATPTICTTSIESWRVRDQGPRIADPALWDVSLGPHLDPAHAATLFKRIDPKKASRDRSGPPADGATRTDRPRHDGVCGGRCGRQHDCRHADAEHVGRDVLRVRRSGLPLQQPSALRRRQRPGPVPAARALVVHERADARVQGARERPPASSARRAWRSAPPGTPGFPRPSTTSS